MLAYFDGRMFTQRIIMRRGLSIDHIHNIRYAKFIQRNRCIIPVSLFYLLKYFLVHCVNVGPPHDSMSVYNDEILFEEDNSR